MFSNIHLFHHIAIIASKKKKIKYCIPPPGLFHKLTLKAILDSIQKILIAIHGPNISIPGKWKYPTINYLPFHILHEPLSSVPPSYQEPYYPPQLFPQLLQNPQQLSLQNSEINQHKPRMPTNTWLSTTSKRYEMHSFDSHSGVQKSESRSKYINLYVIKYFILINMKPKAFSQDLHQFWRILWFWSTERQCWQNSLLVSVIVGGLPLPSHQ